MSDPLQRAGGTWKIGERRKVKLPHYNMLTYKLDLDGCK